MARRRPRRRVIQEPEEILSLAQRGVNVVKPYLKWLILGITALVLVLLGWGGQAYLKRSREARAQAALEQVRPRLSQPEQAGEAIKTLDALIRDYPSTTAGLMARLYQGHLLYQTKKYADAARAYEELRTALGSRDPMNLGPFVTESLSYCYEDQGEYVRAAQTLKPVAEQARGGYQTVLLARLALLYDKAGNPKEAALIWEKLLSQAQNPALLSYWKEKLTGVEAKMKKQGK